MARVSNNMQYTEWKIIAAAMLLGRGESPDVWN